ncbi:MAG: helix-turn-helix domain-containing protein [Thermodesulfobacteriota bacterium]
MTVKQQDKSKIVQIWGDVLDEGFTSVPNILLRYRSSLDIKPQHLVLIIDIMSFKWDSENPFPSYSTLAQRAGVAERSIKRIVQDLEEMNLLIRTQRFDEESGAQITTIFDFRPLVQRLIEVMPKIEEERLNTTDKAKTHKKRGGDIFVTGGVTNMSGGGVTNMSPKEYSYINKTHINKNKSTLKVKNSKNGKDSSLEISPSIAQSEKERVQEYFRNGIFRERLFEIYDNLYNIKLIEELVEEGVYKACKEIMTNRVNELSKNNIKVNPDQIAEGVKSEFPYHKVPKTYEKARSFFVATVCTLTAEKISLLLGKKQV